jgi:hypothetical protein
MTEIYSVGTIAVTEGSVDFVGTGTGWLPPNAKAGDQVNVAGLMIGIAEITDATHGKFAIPYPGVTGAGLPYAIFKTSSEWGTNRSLSMATAEMVQMLSTLEVPNTGLRFDALGNRAGRSNYDDRPTAFGYLSLDGDGAGITAPVVFAKLSGVDADWSPAILFRGDTGPIGPSGILVNWRHAWVTGTAYALKDGVQFGGSSYISLVAHVAGDFATDLAAGRWELTSAKGAPGNDGVLSANEEIVTAASRTITSADNGKIFIADRAGGVTFNFDPVASLGTRWLGMFKNIGAGPLTIDPDAAETIDGVASLMLSTSESAMISGNGALLRSHFRGSAGGKRELLTANRTYYVRADGSDANTGLLNTAGGAFLTPQKAFDTIATLDLAGFDATISIGAGTFNDLAINKPVVGGSLFITGAGATTIMAASTLSAAILVNSAQAALITIAAVKFATAGGSRAGVRVDAAAKVILGAGIEFGACSNSHMLVAAPGGFIHAQQNYAVTGGAPSHMNCQFQGFIRNDTKTVTLTGTPAFTTAFAFVSNGGGMLTGNTWVGAATGKRFEAFWGGYINIQGLGLDNLPGSLPGTVASGGVYDNLVGGARELLTASRTYYVRTDGSDSNDGLTNTAAGAFASIQKAVTATQALDRSTFNVQISIGAGTFNVTQVSLFGMGPGSGSVSIVGAGSTTIINASAHGFYLRNVTITLQNFKVIAAGGDGLRVEAGCYISHSGLDFGTCSGNHIWFEQWTRVVCIGNYTISGGANCHVFGRYSGASYECYAKTITLSGTIAFASSFVAATMHGNIIHGACTFVGTATGKRYSADTGGIIDSGGGGANYFPGSIAGTGTTLAAAPYGAYV